LYSNDRPTARGRGRRAAAADALAAASARDACGVVAATVLPSPLADRRVRRAVRGVWSLVMGSGRLLSLL